MTTTLPKPTSSLSEVLYGLITRREISEQEYDQNGFRTRVGELKKMGLPVKDKTVTGKNKFGRPSTYKVRYLFTIHRKKAIRLYLKLNAHAKVHG